MAPRAWLGIDPGASGAVAMIDCDGVADVRDFQNVTDAAALILEWKTTHMIDLAAVELASARPGQGVRSVFSFGTRFGEWCGLLSGLSIPFVIVPPQRWQRAAGLLPSDGDTKERSLTAARRRWPDVDLHRKGDDGKADALHLAAYARTIQGGL